jgi:hypothetical protein
MNQVLPIVFLTKNVDTDTWEESCQYVTPVDLDKIKVIEVLEVQPPVPKEFHPRWPVMVVLLGEYDAILVPKA